MAKQAIWVMFWVMLKAKPGKEADVEAFLKQGATMSHNEPQTVTWYGVKMGPASTASLIPSTTRPAATLTSAAKSQGSYGERLHTLLR